MSSKYIQWAKGFQKNHINIMIFTKMVVNLVKKVNSQKVEKQKNQSQG